MAVLFKSLATIITISSKLLEHGSHSMVIVSWVDLVFSWGSFVTERDWKWFGIYSHHMHEEMKYSAWLWCFTHGCLFFWKVIVSPECWNKAQISNLLQTSFHSLHTEAISSGLWKIVKTTWIKVCTYHRWFHCNGGVREIGALGCVGVRGVWGGIMDIESDGEGTSGMGPYLPNWSCITPICYVVHVLEGRSMCDLGWVVRLCFWSLSDGVSCKTCSQTFPSSCWVNGH